MLGCCSYKADKERVNGNVVLEAKNRDYFYGIFLSDIRRIFRNYQYFCI